MYFIKGLKNSQVFSYSDTTEYGSFSLTYPYVSARKFDVRYWDDQGEYVFRTVDETKYYEDLDNKFDLGLNDRGLTPTSKIQFGQYDFDGDDIDELVVGVQESKSGSNCENGISINVFKLLQGKWKNIGHFTGECILGNEPPKAQIKLNKITINRNLRGFYYQWTYTDNKFEDTSYL